MTEENVSVVKSDSFSNKALVSGIDVLRGTELVKPEDFEFLYDHVDKYEKRFRTRAIYRSRIEMVASVLNDSDHPTTDSKYWQAICEQNVQLTELINLSYEAKKTEADNELLSAEIEELEEELDNSSDHIEVKKLKAKIKKKRIELAQSQFVITQQQKVAQERLREVKTWEEIIEKLESNLEFGSDNFELHHPKRYLMRYHDRMQLLNQMEPQARESVIKHFKSFSKFEQDGGSPLPIELSLAEKNTKNIPPGLPGSADVNYESIENMMDDDKIIAEKHFKHKVRKILIGVPHRNKEDGNATNFSNLQTPAGFTCSISEPYGYSTADAQNFIVKKAIDEGYDYIFFVGDDILIPKQALVQLIRHDVEMVGGLYYRKYFPLETTGMRYDKEGYPTCIDNYKIGDIIENTLVLCSGCVLIKVETLKKLEYPWYKSINISGRPAITSDAYICQKMRDIGVNIITDTAIQCLCVDRTKGIIYAHPEIVDYQKNEIRLEWRDFFAI